jgi:enamine deaminase RidA (YjgF/YER057c/UK114 family)
VLGSSRIVFISGQVAFDKNRKVVGVGEFAVQMRFVFDRLVTVLREYGLGPSSVASLRTYLTRPADVDLYRTLRTEIATNLWGDGPMPTNTLLVVQQLVDVDLLIEVEAIAVV